MQTGNAQFRDYQWHGPMGPRAEVPKKPHVRTCARDFKGHRYKRETPKSEITNGTARRGAAAVKKRPAAARHRAPHKIRDYQWHGLSRRQKCAQNTNVTHGPLQPISG